MAKRCRYIARQPNPSSGNVVGLQRAAQFGAYQRRRHSPRHSHTVKPMDFESFVAAARELGSYWLLFNQTPGA